MLTQSLAFGTCNSTVRHGSAYAHVSAFGPRCQSVQLALYTQRRNLVTSCSTQQGGIGLSAGDVQLLLGELVATRKQVDKLLDQQAVLINLIAATHPGFTNSSDTHEVNSSRAGTASSQSARQQTTLANRNGTPTTVPTISKNQQASNNGNTTLSQPAAAVKLQFSTESEASSSVNQLLGNLGVIPPGASSATPYPAADGLQSAFQQLNDGDVLSGLEGWGFTTEALNKLPSASQQSSFSKSTHHEPTLPTLVQGATCAWWVGRLHVALLAKGHYSGDKEVQTYTFGVGTADALRKAQQDCGLSPSGICDAATWDGLLADLWDMKKEILDAMKAGQAPAPPSPSSVQPAGQPVRNGTPQPAAMQPGSATLQASTGAAEDSISELKVSGAPPALTLGADDIRWVSWLHRALMANGFYPSEEDCEDWLFGESTLDALLSAQAAAKLPETGVACIPTWQWLLRSPEGDEIRHEVEQALGTSSSTWNNTSSSNDVHASNSSSGSSEKHQTNLKIESSKTEATGAQVSKSTSATTSSPQGWPIIMEGDGSQAVGILQKALEASGYSCGEDEPMWWQCGSDTINALRTFQACNGLPETGVCNDATWKALVKATNSTANNLEELTTHLKSISPDDDDNVDDITAAQQGRVWLIGEQRWERRS